MNQEEIILKIKSGGQSELAAIYEEFRDEFLHWISREYKCSADDSKDIYQLTILIFYDNIRQGKLQQLVSSVKTYLFGIGKNIAKDRLRKEKKFVPMDQEKWLKQHLVDEPSDHIEESIFAKAKSALEKLGQPCQRLVEMFYYEKKSISDITESLGYKNPETAKNQKCKCMARLRKLFEQESTTSTSMFVNHEPR